MSFGFIVFEASIHSTYCKTAYIILNIFSLLKAKWFYFCLIFVLRQKIKYCLFPPCDRPEKIAANETIFFTDFVLKFILFTIQSLVLYNIIWCVRTLDDNIIICRPTPDLIGSDQGKQTFIYFLPNLITDIIMYKVLFNFALYQE